MQSQKRSLCQTARKLKIIKTLSSQSISQASCKPTSTLTTKLQSLIWDQPSKETTPRSASQHPGTIHPSTHSKTTTPIHFQCFSTRQKTHLRLSSQCFKRRASIWLKMTSKMCEAWNRVSKWILKLKEEMAFINLGFIIRMHRENHSLWQETPKDSWFHLPTTTQSPRRRPLQQGNWQSWIKRQRPKMQTERWHLTKWDRVIWPRKHSWSTKRPKEREGSSRAKRQSSTGRIRRCISRCPIKYLMKSRRMPISPTPISWLTQPRIGSANTGQTLHQYSNRIKSWQFQQRNQIELISSNWMIATTSHFRRSNHWTLPHRASKAYMPPQITHMVSFVNQASIWIRPRICLCPWRMTIPSRMIKRAPNFIDDVRATSSRIEW